MQVQQVAKAERTHKIGKVRRAGLLLYLIVIVVMCCVFAIVACDSWEENGKN